MKKRVSAVLLLLLLLCGCKNTDGDLNKALNFRQKLISAERCQFDCLITADYGELIYEFSIRCSFDNDGAMTFEVLQPESIAGITGRVSSDGGALTFDDQSLAFPILADGYISPISAPWLLMKSLRSGYIGSCGKDGEFYKLMLDDSFESNPLQIESWMDQNFVPVRGEMIWLGKRILSLDVTNYSCL